MRSMSARLPRRSGPLAISYSIPCSSSALCTFQHGCPWTLTQTFGHRCSLIAMIDLPRWRGLVLAATILRPSGLDNGLKAVVSSVAMETYTSGAWTVKAGEEDAFVEAWTDFVTWASSFSGSGTFRLVRDVERPNSYLSF